VCECVSACVCGKIQELKELVVPRVSRVFLSCVVNHVNVYFRVCVIGKAGTALATSERSSWIIVKAVVCSFTAIVFHKELMDTIVVSSIVQAT